MASSVFAAPGQISAAPYRIDSAHEDRTLLKPFTLVSVAVVALCIASGAQAQSNGEERGKVYVAAAVTGSKLQKPKQTIANAPAPGSTLQVVNTVDFGWGGQVELGYAYKVLRVEAEIGRTKNHSDSYSAVSPITITIPQDGKNTTTRYMANLFLDLPLKGVPIRPFIGGGVGAAHSYVSTFAAPARAPTAPPSQLLAFSDTRFAYQLMAGAAVVVSPRVAITAQYRWLDSGTVRGIDARGERATRSLRGSNIDVGLRFTL